MTKEYGDAGGLDDLLLVLPEHDVIDIYAPSGQEHNDLELRRY